MDFEKQRKTFLSYSRVNKDFALKLAKELKSEGFDVWLDQLDIPLGARWDREVEKALRESEIFMIILTSASVDSENVLDEIGYAIDTHKRFLPILLEPCEVPLRLRRFQYVDFTNKSFEDGVEAAKSLLRGLIAQHTVPRKAATPEVSANADQQAKKEAERKTNVEAERLAKVDAERKAKEETERKAKEEADRLAKEEADRKAKEEAERLAKMEADRKAKEEADQLAKAEAERLAKAETDRKAREQVKHGTTPTPEKQLKPVPSTSPQKKPIFRGLMIGIGAVVLLGIVGIWIGYSVLFNRDSPSADTPFMKVSDTKSFFRSKNWVNLYDLARVQHTEDEINDFKDHSKWIPVALNESKPMGITYGWCALNSDILQDNLDHITFFFEYNGLPISQSNIVDFYSTTDSGWECLNKVVAFEELGTGEYRLSYGLSINQKLNDGENDYNVGEYARIYLVVTVP